MNLCPVNFLNLAHKPITLLNLQITIFKTFTDQFNLKKNLNKGHNRQYNEGPPKEVIPACKVLRTCENDLVVKSLLEKVPYFNAPIYLENMQPIGKVDEILGPVKGYVIFLKFELVFPDSVLSAI